ncbi:GPW/gp25 family protein [Myxococcota bacterium]|nr:GPW/gp25 family protein [Myxococcota bacterium]
MGINAETGGTITGWAHVEQSLRDIFFTRFGERIMREWYGSFIPQLLGRNITPKEITPFFAALASAVEQWEPRYRVTELVPTAVTRTGELHIFMAGEFRPRALLGDLSVEGARRVDLYASADGIRIEQRRAEA